MASQKVVKRTGHHVWEGAVLLMEEILHQLICLVYPIIYKVYISQVVSRIFSINSITSTTLEFHGLSNFQSPLISPKVTPTRQVFFLSVKTMCHTIHPHMNVAPWHPNSFNWWKSNTANITLGGTPFNQWLLVWFGARWFGIRIGVPLRIPFLPSMFGDPIGIQTTGSQTTNLTLAEPYKKELFTVAPRIAWFLEPIDAWYKKKSLQQTALKSFHPNKTWIQQSQKS